MTARTMKLEPIKVGIDELLLDPNNPRFVQDLRFESEVPDSEVESHQSKLLRRFTLKENENASDGSSDEAHFFSIKDLTDSMMTIGFVPIDRVVVRSLDGSSKYVVIEGNRRVSAAKRLLERDAKKSAATEGLSAELRASLEKLDVLRLDTTGLSAKELHNDIGVILGLRHYGQVLGWEPLPRAVNIYKEYMSQGLEDAFELDSKRITTVAAHLSIPRSEVKNALRTYIAYKQLAASFTPAPKPTHYSLIAALVSNPSLTTHYFDQDASTFELSSESLESLYSIGQFDLRDTTTAILSDPKDAAKLAKLVSAVYGNLDPATRDFAKSLLDEVERSKRPLDDAIDNLKSFMSSRRWIEALSALLAKQEDGLRIEEFSAVGMDIHNLEEATKAFRNVRKILEV